MAGQLAEKAALIDRGVSRIATLILWGVRKFAVIAYGALHSLL